MSTTEQIQRRLARSAMYLVLVDQERNNYSKPARFAEEAAAVLSHTEWLSDRAHWIWDVAREFETKLRDEIVANNKGMQS